MESELREQRASEVRVRWGKRQNYRGKLSLSFDELYDLFSSDCNTFTQIGELSNPPVTRERVRQIYQKYFAGIFGREGGSHRIKLCTIKRHKVAEQETPDTFPAKQVAEEAAKHGLICNRVRFCTKLHHSRSGWRSSLLRINNRLVDLHSTKAKFKPFNIQYGHFDIAATTEGEFSVCVLAVTDSPLRFFVVPNADLCGKHSIYVRLDKYIYGPSKNQNGGWLAQYEDAWDLLR